MQCSPHLFSTPLEVPLYCQYNGNMQLPFIPNHMNKLAFVLAGRRLNAGFKVDIPLEHPTLNMKFVSTEECSDKRAIKKLTAYYKDNDLGNWLSEHTHYVVVERVLKWPRASIMNMYQIPEAHFHINTIHFHLDADAMLFKLRWL